MTIGGNTQTRGYCIWVIEKNRHFQYILPVVYGPSRSTVPCGTREGSHPIVRRNATKLAPTSDHYSRVPQELRQQRAPGGPAADLSRIQGMVIRPVVATVTVMVRPEDVWVIV